MLKSGKGLKEKSYKIKLYGAGINAVQRKKEDVLGFTIFIKLQSNNKIFGANRNGTVILTSRRVKTYRVHSAMYNCGHYQNTLAAS